MRTNDTAVIEALKNGITEINAIRNEALTALENLSTTKMQHKKACIQLSVAAFISAYLNRALQTITNGHDAESVLRFHASHLRSFADLNEDSETSIAAWGVTELFERLININYN